MAEKKFEDSLERLETIVEKMESGDLTLDQAMKYYEEGIRLSRFCYKKLDEAEKKIEKLVKKSGAEGRTEYGTEPLDLFEGNNEP
jgi:exodeoxyribonuclease VII small subunit